jgi:adenylosuccinate lyase
MVTGTLGRIGTEVYELARPEIGELAEPAPAAGVSSITMPHKRNPEFGEHLDTLARLARSSAAVLLEGMVAGHERDGRAWKAEWIALPEVCQLTGAALALGIGLLAGLEVHADAMAANAERFGPALGSERVLAGLTAKLGRDAAQRVMHEILRGDRADAPVGAAPSSSTAPHPRPGAGGTDLAAALAARGLATAAEVRAWAEGPAVAAAGAMVDAVIARLGP